MVQRPGREQQGCKVAKELDELDESLLCGWHDTLPVVVDKILQYFFERNSGRMVYMTWVPIMWALYWNERRRVYDGVK